MSLSPTNILNLNDDFVSSLVQALYLLRHDLCSTPLHASIDMQSLFTNSYHCILARVVKRKDRTCLLIWNIVTSITNNETKYL